MFFFSWALTDLFGQGLAVTSPRRRILDVDGPPIELELALITVPVGNCDVDGTTRISQQVQCLPGWPHQLQV